MKITNECNMDLMSRYEDNYFDLAIVDPPFPVNTNGGGKCRTLMRSKDWDNSIPQKEYFLELKRVSKNYIICGGNFFTQYLEPNNKWIIWHKNHAGDKTNFSEAELFYSTCKGNTRVFKYSIIGKSLEWHACPKPVKLYEWLLINYAKEGDKILDTHLGSGSIAIACHNLGYDLTACELDRDYYNAAMKRIEQHKNQIRLFS
tara:strand:+ start:479 stop:1084 length:606 start_codon:yes stop_codon:yes gene_type:complete